METLTDYPVREETLNPRAVMLVLCNQHQFLTFIDSCEHNNDHVFARYGVIGTDYGHLRNTAGNWQLWQSASSAYRAARQLRDYYGK